MALGAFDSYLNVLNLSADEVQRVLTRALEINIIHRQLNPDSLVNRV